LSFITTLITINPMVMLKFQF